MSIRSDVYFGAALALLAPLSSPMTLAAVAAQHEKLGFATLSASELSVMLGEKNFTLVNVHVPYEGEIAQTDLFIPFDEIAGHRAELPPDKSAKIILYCKSGRMSAEAAATLVNLGYLDVSHLTGGMNAWTEAGHDLLSSDR